LPDSPLNRPSLPHVQYPATHRIRAEIWVPPLHRPVNAIIAGRLVGDTPPFAERNTGYGMDTRIHANMFITINPS